MAALRKEAELWFRTVADGPTKGKMGVATQTGSMSIETGPQCIDLAWEEVGATSDHIATELLERLLDKIENTQGTDLCLSSLVIYNMMSVRDDIQVWFAKLIYYSLPVWRLEELERRFSPPTASQ